MENLVIVIDGLDNEISKFKAKIVQGLCTEEEVNLCFYKIGQRALLNAELEQVREGECLLISTFFINLWAICSFST